MLPALLVPFFATSQDENAFAVKWNNGYSIESADKQFKMKFGGRLMWDNAFYFQDDTLEASFGKLNNGTEFRRARFFNEGYIYHRVHYKFEADFAGGKTSFKDAFIELTGMPWAGNLRAGYFKEPFRLEVMTSSKYITFMERAFPVSFLPERNAGMALYGDLAGKRLSWQAGVFRGADGTGNDTKANDGYAVTGRITGLPLLNEDKRQRILIGAAYSYRKPDEESYKIESKPESNMAPKYVSTGTVADVTLVSLGGLEAALDVGSFSLQSEYVRATVDTRTIGGYTFSSWYAQAGFFLTGESRAYTSSYSGYDRVKPKKNFGNEEGGCGAWEAAVRYSTINLNDKDVSGGEMSDITLGLNWYLNPATRIMANYVMADLANRGKTGIFQVRFQVDF